MYSKKKIEELVKRIEALEAMVDVQSSFNEARVRVERENFNREISYADAMERIAQEKGAIILGLSLKQLMILHRKIVETGINFPVTDEDIESLKINADNLTPAVKQALDMLVKIKINMKEDIDWEEVVKAFLGKGEKREEE